MLSDLDQKDYVHVPILRICPSPFPPTLNYILTMTPDEIRVNEDLIRRGTPEEELSMLQLTRV